MGRTRKGGNRKGQIRKWKGGRRRWKGKGREEGKGKARVGEELRTKNGGGETTHTQLSLTKSVCSQGLLFFFSFIRIQIKYK